jgi:hypothetical protein
MKGVIRFLMMRLGKDFYGLCYDAVRSLVRIWKLWWEVLVRLGFGLFYLWLHNTSTPR